MEGTAKLNALLLLIRGDNLGHSRNGVRFACINGRSVLALHIGQGLRADIGTSRAEPRDHIADSFIRRDSLYPFNQDNVFSFFTVS